MNEVMKQCISCGEEGHHYNECKKVDFWGILGGAMGLNTEAICGKNKEQLLEDVDKYMVKVPR